MSTRERTPFPSADEIAARAHELFASGGRRVSLIPEYWRTAERELLARQPSLASVVCELRPGKRATRE
jgi:hypothetical protein